MVACRVQTESQLSRTAASQDLFKLFDMGQACGGVKRKKMSLQSGKHSPLSHGIMTSVMGIYLDKGNLEYISVIKGKFVQKQLYVFLR